MESPSLGHKRDSGWKYCEMLKEGEKVHIKCIYCGKIFKGGGIFRLKEHLAGRKGGGPICQRVPPDVRVLMEQALDGSASSAKQNKQRVSQERLSLGNNDFDNTPEQPLTTTKVTRHKKDLAWKYCQALKIGDRVQIKCNYCDKVFKGGGIYRFKEHLAGRKGAAPVCERVPSDIRLSIQECLHEVVPKQKKKQRMVTEDGTDVDSPTVHVDTDAFANPFHYEDDENGVPVPIDPYSNFPLDEDDLISQGNTDSRKRGRGKTPLAVVDNSGPLNILHLKKVDNAIHSTMGKFLYDIGANFDALDSTYFQRLVDMLSSGASGILAPSNHDLRGWILKKLVEEIKNDIEHFRTTWTRTGCSIMVEEWNSERGTVLLNIFVNCSQGTVFLKSVDASHIIYSPDDLYMLLKQVVEEVGPGNVLQVITHGEKHYIAAGKRLMDTFPSLYWAPCAAHCIDLILEDMGKLEWINAVIEQAKSVTRFVYNHSTVLNLMRKFTGGKDIVQQGLTRSATNFTMLQRMADFKLSLQTMITSQEWIDCPYAKQLGGSAMLEIIGNRSFWSSCILIIRLTSPLLRVLGIASSKKKAGMGYIFAGMYRAKETIKREFVKREDYMVYWNIIDNRWDQQRQPPLHVAGFFLNPNFFYSIEGDVHNEITSRVFDCIEKLVPDIEIQDKIVKELHIYKSAAGDLGRKMAIRSRETLLPAEWWSTYGGGCLNLARLALRILSQTCSSIGCRRNHIPFEKVHATRNLLERKRLNDVVFVQCNLRLKQIVDESKSQVSVDPISFDDISAVEDWILQNDVCMEDYESSDWMALVPPSANAAQVANNMPAGSAIDEIEDLGVGFADFEIFEGLKEFK
ncbi:uncharacterized protein LOC126681279 [Mercurialis annua]|uniref:uncharacterized protein LOC126681279 n=1 Tax=Mercurialis annua TaxID=3986 RepID=UPI0021603918|nr:uncharacterized protein LOC126681279 [Mercurialis annua]